MEEARGDIRQMRKILSNLIRQGYGDDPCFMFFPQPGQSITQIEDAVECKIEFVGEVWKAHRNWRLCILERTRNET